MKKFSPCCEIYVGPNVSQCPIMPISTEESRTAHYRIGRANWTCLPLRAITPDLHTRVQPTEVAVAGPESFCNELECDPVAESATYVKSLAGGLSNIIGYRWSLANAIADPLIPDMLHLAAIGIRDDDGLPDLFPGLR